MRQQQPDPNAAGAVAAMAGRLDRIEQQVTALNGLAPDVTALGRAVAETATQVRDLAARPTRAARRVEDDGEEVQLQPDWLVMSLAPSKALAILTVVEDYVEDILTPMGVRLTPCWAIHPSVVVELVALHQQYRFAYRSSTPTEVSEYLARWLPTAADRIGHTLERCRVEGGHVEGTQLFHGDGWTVRGLAAWWADSHGRGTPASQALALTPISN